MEPETPKRIVRGWGDIGAAIGLTAENARKRARGRRSRLKKVIRRDPDSGRPFAFEHELLAYMGGGES